MLRNVCQRVARFNLKVLGGMPWSRAVAVLVVAALVVVSGLAAPMAQAQTRGGGGGRDIHDDILFDILGIAANSTVPQATGNGGGGGGADIIIFDIVDSVANSTVPQATRKGGGVLPDFVLVNAVSSSQVMLLGESEAEDAYWGLVDMGDSVELGLMWANESGQSILIIRLQMKF